MERDQDQSSDLIELGTASTATRGAWGHYADEVLMQDMPGLSDD